MIGQIRLAERRGLLSGPSAGRVQVAALGALMVHEAVVRSQETEAWNSSLEMESDAEPLTDADADAALESDGPISWSADEEYTPDDVMGILSEIGRDGTISLEDVE